MNKPRIITIGSATLICGDAYEERPKLGFIDADMIDPPYLIATSGGGKMRKDRPYLDEIQEMGIADGFDYSIINSLLTGNVTVFCSNDQVPTLSTYLNGNFHRFTLGFWQKSNPLPVANKARLADVEIWFNAWNRGHEPIGELKDKRRGIAPDMDEDGNEFSKEEEKEFPAKSVKCPVAPSKTYGHPTVKPAAVMNAIMRSTPGETICDSFMGTGSTGVAAILDGRKFIGIEKSEKHFETAIQRITQAHKEYEALQKVA